MSIWESENTEIIARNTYISDECLDKIIIQDVNDNIPIAQLINKYKILNYIIFDKKYQIKSLLVRIEWIIMTFLGYGYGADGIYGNIKYPLDKIKNIIQLHNGVLHQLPLVYIVNNNLLNLEVKFDKKIDELNAKINEMNEKLNKSNQKILNLKIKNSNNLFNRFNKLLIKINNIIYNNIIHIMIIIDIIIIE